MAPNAAEPPSVALSITTRQIRELDLSPLAPLQAASVESLVAMAGQLDLELHWPRADDDPRELSEVPEVRLWSLRADFRMWRKMLLGQMGPELARADALYPKA